MSFDKKEFLEQLESSEAYVLSCLNEDGSVQIHVEGEEYAVERIFAVVFEKLEEEKYNVLKNVLYRLILNDVGKVKIENSLEILRTTERLFELLEKNMKGENNGSKTHEENYSQTY